MKKPNGREGLPLAASDIEQEARNEAEAMYSMARELAINTNSPMMLRETNIAINAYAKALIAERTKASTSEGDQLSEEVERIIQMIEAKKAQDVKDVEQVNNLLNRLGRKLNGREYEDVDVLLHDSDDLDAIIKELRSLSDPRRSKMVEARPVVQWFAGHMEAALRRNDHKGGWTGHNGLLGRLREETEELEAALTEGGAFRDRTNDVIREAADVANFAMMLADNEGPRIGHERNAAIGGEDGGGPLSGDGGGGDLGVPASEGGRPTAAAGDDAEPSPSSSRAHAQGPIDAVPAHTPTFKPTKP